MFKKKSCKKCGEKINEKDKFCSNCGFPIGKDSKKDFGLIGTNDFGNPFEEIQFPRGLNTIFNSLMKNLDKQMRNIDQEMKFPKKDGKIKKSGISISISTSGNKPPRIKVNSFGNDPKLKKKEEQIKKEIKEILPTFSKENIKKMTNLPRKEPETKLRRLSNKIVYEIDLPGVNSIKDVSIIKLENSIEIKAISKEKVYLKLIPINLPISDYRLEKGKLILELETKD